MADGMGLHPPSTITFTCFRDHRAAEKWEVTESWDELAQRVRIETKQRKADLPWLKLARLGAQKTEKGSLRHDANVLEITGIEGDYDGEQHDPAYAIERLHEAGVRAMVYTSPSHTEDTPRWRVLCPVSKSLPPQQREHLLGRLNGLLGGILSGESFTLSQAYYYGSVRMNPSHVVELVDGQPIDLCDGLDAGWMGKPSTGERTTGADGKPRAGKANQAKLIEEIVAGDTFHAATVRLAGVWAFSGVSLVEARERLFAAFDAVPEAQRGDKWTTRRADVERCLLDIYGKQARKQDQPQGSGNGSDFGEMFRHAQDQFQTEEAARQLASDLSDDSIALAFSSAHDGALLHVAEWSHWLRWDSARWARDTTLTVFDMARKVCRQHASLARDGSRIASAQKVAAVERLARSDRRHAREASAFDADPLALNTPGGVIDLRSAIMRQHRRDDLFTKITTVAPSGNCPRWLAFLHEVLRGDAEAIAYLQRWAGYMLTGETREHAFLFIYGPGGNGKGVLVNTLAAALGDYATTAPMETFMATQQDRHPTDLAGLRGARLVLAQETEAGRVLAESRIKALTGGDRIAARFMRGDFFEFNPAFKLVMVGNHRPVIRNPDDAMRRRLHLLPLTYRPPSPDPELPAVLRAELPGILQWAMAGCRAWQQQGLGMPSLVRAATAEYFVEQDLMAQWLADRCEPAKDATAASAALFRDWEAWAKARGEQPGTNKAFSAALERHYAKKRTEAGAAFIGLRLKPSDTGVW